MSWGLQAFAWTIRRCGGRGWIIGQEVILQRHSSLESLNSSLPEARLVYLTTKSDKSYVRLDLQR
jgi:hypothetical protein